MTDHKHIYDRVPKLAGSWIACVECGEPYRGPNFVGLVNDREALLPMVPVLERIANYPFGGHTPPEMRKLASDALATLPEHLK